ncbi:hypothetical protein FRZ67_05210 [Panacibacter ginsenosidivorans]|uniref:Uncharacterized protein n=1 Tax=Panacibacter ginsenosidivorans TaxID=1813871 RepID=A0A5B8V6B1_9BACT|nr:hypothetical protein [Panacibacter ginsenosidivorans]QEC66729.1 hypothetical protein FRZ67_05210 [Panacibacter ginsenosidivorans]
MTEDQIIDQIIHSFSNYSLRDIEEINNNKLDFTIAEFILCSCFIDQISGFRYNKEKVGERSHLYAISLPNNEKPILDFMNYQ